MKPKTPLPGGSVPVPQAVPNMMAKHNPQNKLPRHALHPRGRNRGMKK